MTGIVRIGLIGCGRAAERLHVPAILNAADIRLAAVADPSYERRQLLSSGIPDCLEFESSDALLRGGDISAVIISSPPKTHVPLAAAALGAGIHVLVEKPLAPSVPETLQLKTLPATTAGFLMMGFNQRYWEPVSKLRNLLRERARSDVLSARFVMTSNVRAWQSISEVSDPLDDMGSHLFDLVRYIFAREIYSVSAQWSGRQSIEMRVKLDGNTVVTGIAAHGDVTRESLTICCAREQFTILLGSERLQPAAGSIRRVLDLTDTVSRRIQGARSSLRRSYEQQLSRFICCIRTGTAPEPGIEDGIASVVAVEAARRSAGAGGVEVTV